MRCSKIQKSIVFVVLLSLMTTSCAPTSLEWFPGDQGDLSHQLILVPEEIDLGDRFADEDAEETESSPEVDENGNPRNRAKAPKLPDQIAKAKPKSEVDKQKVLNKTILYYLRWVLDNEASIPGIGNACNFFLQRVLRLSGFSKAHYLANDFDVYAKEAFRNQKILSFTVDGNSNQAEKLNSFFQSYPVATPFIVQWERPKGPGHVAFVVRTKDDFIVYQASLGKPTAVSKRTSPKILLSYSANARINVYVGFAPIEN